MTECTINKSPEQVNQSSHLWSYCTSLVMTVPPLPPIPKKFLVGKPFISSKQKRVKLKRTHCYKLRKLPDALKLHRLGSGFFHTGPHDSVILTYLLPRMPVMMQLVLLSLRIVMHQCKVSLLKKWDAIVTTGIITGFIIWLK